MENENSEIQVEEISQEDFEIIVKIIEKALTYRDHIKDTMSVEEFYVLTDEEKVDETLTNRVDKWYLGNLPCIFFRFVGSQSPLITANFYPVEAVANFLDETRRKHKHFRTDDQTDEDIENLAFEDAVDMFLILIDNFWQRGMLMMDSFVDETIAQWQYTNYKRYLRNNIAVGNKIEPIKYNTVNEAVDIYSKKLKAHWEQHGQNEESWKKVRLFEEYEPIYKHWKMVLLVYKKDGNWREYAKTNGFEDCPDDLLNKFENTSSSKLYQIAMEHAGRRVGLLKQTGVKKSALVKRSEGVHITDYTYQQLKGFENEGKKLAEKIEKVREFEQQREILKVKSRKLVENNLKYIKEENQKLLEQTKSIIKVNENNKS